MKRYIKHIFHIDTV